jgi:hypothetical protein
MIGNGNEKTGTFTSQQVTLYFILLDSVTSWPMAVS